jgi:FMN phosphatase YigB (HAD superfamily)
MTTDWLKDNTIKLVSFDVFDTMIARRCGSPKTIFRIVGGKLSQSGLISVNPFDFQKMRAEAEQQSRRHNGNRETSLARIYSQLNAFWMLPESAVEKMISIELETETENLFAIPGASALLQTMRNTGRRIVFTSDMYLPEEFLRGILSRLGLMLEGEAIYVSSRWGVSKADGGLFRVLLEQEKLKPAEMLHLGDHYEVDFKRARKLGINAVHYDRGALNRYEIRLAEAEDRCGSQIPGLAGISRMARLESDSFGAQQVAARLGASVAGPLLTQYAEWVLRTARSRGVKKLYFLARDGEALLKLCQILAHSTGADGIELRYLFGSRQVWYPHALLPMDEAAARFFSKQVAFSSGSWKECVELLGFKSAEFSGTVYATKWAGWLAQEEKKRELFLDIAGDVTMGSRMKKWLTERSGLTARYFREMGLVDSDKIGLVDCGWSGTWTDVVGDIIEAEGGTRPEVFFLGQRKRKTVARCKTMAYLYDHEAGLGLKDLPDYFHVPVEFFLTANHGRTMGFQEDAGKLVPTLAPVDLQGFTQEQWMIFRSALIRFAELYSAQIRHGRASVDLRDVLLGGVILLWERPSYGDAALMGAHTISLSPTKNGVKKLARPYKVVDVLRLAFRLRLPDYPPFWWHQGAQTLSGPVTRCFMGILWQSFRCVRAVRSAGPGVFQPRSMRRLFLSVAKHLVWELQVRKDSAYLPHGDAGADDMSFLNNPTSPRRAAELPAITVI